MATKTLLTIEQYMALGEDPPGVRYELSDGELIVTPSPNYSHNQISDKFKDHLELYLLKHPIGVAIRENDVKISEATVRRPDVAFIHKDRLKGVGPHDNPLPTPNLAIEVISPSDRASDIMKKVFQYLEAGVQVVWLFDTGTLHAYRQTSTSGRLITEVFSEDKEFSEPELLPGFTLKISEIFTWGNDPMNASGPLPSQDTGGH